LKANNGIYLIDDFGRQRATPAEVLNRWIVPMERRTDYLSFLTGGKMTAPFDTFLVFSTNLNPTDLGDEAFLRRIQYKMLLRGPSETEFVRIFENFCSVRRIPVTREMITRFVDRHYRGTTRPFRRCHPRDVLTHAINLIHFEKLPLELNDQLLDRAFESCFVQEEEGVSKAESVIMPVAVQTCADYWGDKVAEIHTAFGTLMFTASFRDRSSGRYHDAGSARQYGDSDTERTLARMHARSFQDWQSLSQEQQTRDLKSYLACTEGAAERLKYDRLETARLLTPATAKPQDAQTFSQEFCAVLDSLYRAPDPGEDEWAPGKIGKIA